MDEGAWMHGNAWESSFSLPVETLRLDDLRGLLG